MKNLTSGIVVSNLQVLRAISDQLSMDIINAVSKDAINSDNIMRTLDLTPKVYYSRTSRLLNLGLISRKDGALMLTSFGRLIYNAQLKIAMAFKRSSELRMIDAVKSNSWISDDQQKILIDKLIDDSETKRLVTLTVHP